MLVSLKPAIGVSILETDPNGNVVSEKTLAPLAFGDWSKTGPDFRDLARGIRDIAVDAWEAWDKATGGNSIVVKIGSGGNTYIQVIEADSPGDAGEVLWGKVGSAIGMGLAGVALASSGLPVWGTVIAFTIAAQLGQEAFEAAYDFSGVGQAIDDALMWEITHLEDADGDTGYAARFKEYVQSGEVDLDPRTQESVLFILQNISHLAGRRFLSDHVLALKDGMSAAESAPTSSPIVFDLKGDGFDITRPEQSGVYFDRDGNGVEEVGAWFGAGTAILVRDANGDRQIDFSEWFGDLVTSGYTELRTLDAIPDGVIDANDPLFSQLELWEDKNENGDVDPNELKSLAAHGIVSIGLNVSSVYLEFGDSGIEEIATFKRADGTVGKTGDVWFAYDPTHTRIEPGSTVIVPEALLLPQLRGYGTVPDLYIAMSRDALLLGEVRSFSRLDADALHEVTGRTASILMRWAQAQDVDPASRGANIDARKLATLEAFYGEAFQSNAGSADPNLNAARELERTWDAFVQAIGARLTVQVHSLAPAFPGLAFDLLHDDFARVADVARAIDDVRAQGPADLPSALNYWAAVVPILDAANASQPDPGYETALSGALAPAHLADQINALRHPVRLELGATEILYAEASGSWLVGNGSNDQLRGEQGNDILDGGKGNDQLNGGAGNDLYLINRGAGADTILETGGSDVIRFGTGIARTDLRFEHASSDLVIYIGAAGDRVRITSQFSSSAGNSVEQAQFADGSTLDLKGQLTFTGTQAAESLFGLDNGSVLEGLAGNDQLYGGEGNDVLIGGIGNDTLRGYAGNDSYLVPSGAGADAILETGGSDVIRFGAGVARTDLRFEHASSDLVIHIGAAGDRVRIVSQFSSSLGYRVEQAQFADGSTLDLTGPLTFTGTAAAESLFGLDNGSVLEGLAGNDQLYGGAGNDVLIGGIGDDSLRGYAGNDSYLVPSGAGADTILETGGSDVIRFGAGVARTDLRFEHASSDLVIHIGAAGDRVRITSQFSSSAGNSVEQAQFADGSTLDLKGQLTFTGTQAAESLFGLDNGSVLEGLAGNDQLYGGEGNDVLIGGIGNDTLRGYAGNDSYLVPSGAGADAILETGGSDVIRFGAGVARTDLRFEHASSDLVIHIGAAGDRVRIVSQFSSSLGYRVEQAQFADGSTLDLTGPLTFTGTAAAESLFGLDNGSVLEGLAGNDQLYGGAGNDVLIGGIGDDSLRGYAGNDRFLILGAAGNDTIRDSGGNDRIELDTTAEHTVFRRDSGDLLIQTDTGQTTRVADFFNSAAYVVEDLQYKDGSRQSLTGALTFTGTPAADVMTSSGQKHDTLRGLAGDDTLYGQDGNNVLYGGSGNDLIYAGEGNDILIGDAGDDAMRGDAGDDRFLIRGAAGNDTIRDSGGNDRIELDTTAEHTVFRRDSGDLLIQTDTGQTTRVADFFNWAVYVVEDLQYKDGSRQSLTGALTFTGTPAADVMTSSGQKHDTLRGLAGDDILYGQDGNNLLYGGAGNDLLLGGAGDDYLAGGAGGDVLNGGAGRDFARYDSGTTPVVIDLLAPSLNVGEAAGDSYLGIEGIVGSGFNDVLRGASGNDELQGRGGNDTIDGRKGDDTIRGGLGLDVLTGGPGKDTFTFARGDAASGDKLVDFDGLAGAPGDRLIFSGYGTKAMGARFDMTPGNPTHWIITASDGYTETLNHMLGTPIDTTDYAFI